MILDTHVAVWLAEGVSIRAGARRRIEAAAVRGGLVLSAISAWEIATLVRSGRLRVATTTESYVRDLFALRGVREAPVTAEIARRAGELSDVFHGDPADRIIVATASVLGVPLATRDDRIVTFAKTVGGLACVTA